MLRVEMAMIYQYIEPIYRYIYTNIEVCDILVGIDIYLSIYIVLNICLYLQMFFESVSIVQQ